LVRQKTRWWAGLVFAVEVVSRKHAVGLGPPSLAREGAPVVPVSRVGLTACAQRPLPAAGFVIFLVAYALDGVRPKAAASSALWRINFGLSPEWPGRVGSASHDSGPRRVKSL